MALYPKASYEPALSMGCLWTSTQTVFPMAPRKNLSRGDWLRIYGYKQLTRPTLLGVGGVQ